MKTLITACAIFSLITLGCNKEDSVKQSQGSSETAGKVSTGQSNVKDDVSQNDIVKVAVGSKDHSTLVTALQAADLVNSLANAGPFTVFAPVNAAFEKLPAGTVDDLLKPENKSKLSKILQHHVAVGVYNKDMLTDGRVLGMVDGANATVSNKGGEISLDGAKVLATVTASNGIVYVVDSVVLPK
ncbi:MAG: fasciclin domain-containing protein [Ignavibacteria bacterium]|nr:fasciclin domain-containing protein [Ignavibacteria bacterium]